MKTRCKLVPYLVGILALSTLGFAQAQDAKSNEAAPVKVPKHNCAKPTQPDKLATDQQHKQFRRQVDDYRECLINYSGEMRRAAQAHIEAGNTAAQEYNEFIKVVNAADADKK